MPLFFSDKKNILYIHIPKTGGVSITAALSKHGHSYLSQKYPEKNYNVPSAHLTSKEVNNILIKNEIDVDFEFTIVRNPYHKLESEYFYQFATIYRIKEWSIKTFLKLKNFSSFNKFIKKELSFAINNPEYKNNHFKPQVKFLSDKTKIYKFENKFLDLKKDLSNYDINFQIGKKQYTRGVISKLFKIKWNRNSLNLVNEFYKDDFEMLDYEKK